MGKNKITLEKISIFSIFVLTIVAIVITQKYQTTSNRIDEIRTRMSYMSDWQARLIQKNDNAVNLYKQGVLDLQSLRQAYIVYLGAKGDQRPYDELMIEAKNRITSFKSYQDNVDGEALLVSNRQITDKAFSELKDLEEKGNLFFSWLNTINYLIALLGFWVSLNFFKDE